MESSGLLAAHLQPCRHVTCEDLNFIRSKLAQSQRLKLNLSPSPLRRGRVDHTNSTRAHGANCCVERGSGRVRGAECEILLRWMHQRSANEKRGDISLNASTICATRRPAAAGSP